MKNAIGVSVSAYCFDIVLSTFIYVIQFITNAFVLFSLFCHSLAGVFQNNLEKHIARYTSTYYIKDHEIERVRDPLTTTNSAFVALFHIRSPTSIPLAREKEEEEKEEEFLFSVDGFYKTGEYKYTFAAYDLIPQFGTRRDSTHTLPIGADSDSFTSTPLFRLTGVRIMLYTRDHLEVKMDPGVMVGRPENFYIALTDPRATRAGNISHYDIYYSLPQKNARGEKGPLRDGLVNIIPSSYFYRPQYLTGPDLKLIFDEEIEIDHVHSSQELRKLRQITKKEFVDAKKRHWKPMLEKSIPMRCRPDSFELRFGSK
jgi:hypothetical protein